MKILNCRFFSTQERCIMFFMNVCTNLGLISVPCSKKIYNCDACMKEAITLPHMHHDIVSTTIRKSFTFSTQFLPHDPSPHRWHFLLRFCWCIHLLKIVRCFGQLIVFPNHTSHQIYSLMGKNPNSKFRLVLYTIMPFYLAFMFSINMSFTVLVFNNMLASGIHRFSPNPSRSPLMPLPPTQSFQPNSKFLHQWALCTAVSLSISYPAFSFKHVILRFQTHIRYYNAEGNQKSHQQICQFQWSCSGWKCSIEC